MKFSGKSAGFCLLGAAYLVSAFLVFRHSEKAVEPGRVTIRISQWQLETGVREAIDAIIHRYEQINPHVHVVQIAVPGGPTYTSWVLTQMTGGAAPDLVQYSWINPDIAQNFQPISAEVMKPNPYNRGTPLEGVPWRDTFIDGLNNPDSFNESLHEYYAVTMDAHLSRIVYNRPLLKTITGSDRPPATYREMLALCARIRAYAQAHGLNLAPMANSRDTYGFQTWLISMDMANQMAERIDFRHRLEVEADDLGRSYLQGDWSYDTPEAVASIEELKEYGAMSTPGFWERERDTAVTDFVCERTVMIVAPSWEATNLLGLCKFSLAAFPFPYPREDDPVYGRYAQGPFSEGQVSTGLPIYLNRATKHRAEAIDFLRFMTSREGSTLFTQVSNWPPATIGVKPSAFASQFKLQFDGYCWGGNLMIPSGGGDAQNFILTHLADLWESNGSVDAFRQDMREGIGDKIRGDLRHEIASALDNLRRVDIQATAQMEVEPAARRPDMLPLVTIYDEALIYQNRSVTDPAAPTLATSVPSDETENLSPGHDLKPAPAPRDGAKTGAPPQLRPAWQALADYQVKPALEIFDGQLHATDPALARAARFGRGLILLDEQPVSAEHVEEARRLFAGLADSGADDAAQGAQFFLGRIAQHHQETPDPAEAARQYRRLASAYPDSVWAQTALSRLALLEIYELDPQSPPEARIARAENLLAIARTPGAENDLHMAIAYAIFFYRLPAAEALPHLLAAERLRRLDWQARKEVLVQIAELSRIAGDKPQAAKFYRMFLHENPHDMRVYIVKKRLTPGGTLR